MWRVMCVYFRDATLRRRKWNLFDVLPENFILTSEISDFLQNFSVMNAPAMRERVILIRQGLNRVSNLSHSQLLNAITIDITVYYR